MSGLRLSALRLAKYSNTPIGWFLELPVGEFYAWMEVIGSEIKRENDEIDKAAKK
jgi:hypothetical protein